MQPLIIYLDMPLLGGLLGWIQDSALLWMVGQITSHKIHFGRCLIGGLTGGVFQFFLLINQASAGIAYSWVLSPLLYIAIVPGIMIGITFYPQIRSNVLGIIGYFYLLSFLLAGFHWGIDSLNHRFFHISISLGWRFLIHMALLFILGELGWGIVHRKIWEHVCLYQVEVRWGEQKVRFTALLDTGNTLSDPLTKAPVAIAEIDLFRRYLPPEFLDLAQGIWQGEFPETLVLPEGWDERLRILPFQSVGRSGGMLIGFRPDEVTVWEKDKAITRRDLIVAFSKRNISSNGAYQGLISPMMLTG